MKKNRVFVVETALCIVGYLVASWLYPLDESCTPPPSSDN